MSTVETATRDRIVEVAMKALEGCYLHRGHFGDTAAGMVADALIKEMPAIRHASVPGLHPSGPLTDEDKALYDDMSETEFAEMLEDQAKYWAGHSHMVGMFAGAARRIKRSLEGADDAGQRPLSGYAAVDPKYYSRIADEIEPPFEVTCNREALERFRAHPDVIAALGEPHLSSLARYVMLDALKAPDKVVYMSCPETSGQELLDAGLVARTIHTDGRTTYRLTAAGKRWRAAS